jgi:hypothetical protein
MVLGQGAPVWAASTSRAGAPMGLPGGAFVGAARVADLSRDRALPDEELADTIATTSPAGAREVRATPGDQSVKSGGANGSVTSGQFELSIEDDPASLGRAFLVYDLSGLSSFVSAVRSINGSTPLGGAHTAPSADGGVQVEEISPLSLRRGANSIEFLPAPQGDGTGYRVANLRVVFVRDSTAPARNDAHPDLVIAHPRHGECAGGAAYVRGFVAPAANASGAATVLVDGKPIPSQIASDGSFSVTVQRPGRESSAFSFEVAARYPDGAEVSRPVTVDGCDDGVPDDVALSAAHARGKLVQDPGAPFGAVVYPWAAKTLSYGGATIEIPAGAVDKTVRITIRPLPASQLAKMNEGMKNVSPGSGGYRFGPHGLTFKTPITIKLPVDDALLPTGKDKKDVSAFFYDEQDYHWKSVGRAHSPDSRKPGARSSRSQSAPPVTKDVASRTTHFTDFVNATLAVPEHPTAQSFNENLMKDMKLGDPAAGITLIEPPSANSFGAANLSFPIEVPPGRNGIQPELAIRYNSDNTQNGWLGIGWDLQIPAIEVDTRFGAPAYGTASETESYLFDGEALAPTASLSAPTPRSGSQKTFTRRVEGKFDQIVRVGTTPAGGASNANSYYWVVTDQRGTKFYFGANPSGVRDPNSRLESYAGAPASGIFRWYLKAVVDTFGNEMDLFYFHDDGQDQNSSEPFTQTYPAEIRYTKGASIDSAYHVFFDLEQTNQGLSLRPDRIITGRPGFQVKTRYRLGAIRVTQGASNAAGTLIRRYNLSYTPGDFSKSLLTTLDQLGGSGTQLGRHTFTYDLRQNDSRPAGTQYALFDDATTWGGSPLRSDGGLTRSTDQSSGGSGRAGIGIGPFSLTGDGGGFGGDETTDISFFDLTGNSVPDFADEGTAAINELLRQRPGVAPVGGPNGFLSPLVSNTGSFGQRVGVQNLSSAALGHTNRSGWNAGGGLNLGGFFSASGQYLHSSSDDDSIVADVNGDGLPDLVRLDDDDDIQVRLNDGKTPHAPTDPSGGFSATEQSCWGPGCDPTVQTSTLNANDVVSGDPSRDSQFAVSSHLVDPIVRWVAPFAGSVTLDGAITKVRAGGLDGVHVQIFHEGPGPFLPNSPPPAPFWERDFAINDTIPCVPSAGNGCNGTPFTFNVQANERFYTRVDAKDDTHQDDLDWDTTFHYSVDASVQGAREPFGASAYTFSLANDLRLAGPPTMPWKAPTKGTVSIASDPIVDGTVRPVVLTLNGTLSDNLQVQIVQTGSKSQTYTATVSPSLPSDSHTIDATQTGSVSLTFPPIDVEEKDKLTIQVVSDSQIDPNRITFKPYIRYSDIYRVDTDAKQVVHGAPTCLSPNPAAGCFVTGHPRATIPTNVLQLRTQVFYPVFEYEPHGAVFNGAPPPNTPPEGTQGVQHTAAASIAASTITSNVSGVAMVQGINRLIAKVHVNAGVPTPVPAGTDPAAASGTTAEVIFTFYAQQSPPFGLSVSWAPNVDGNAAPVNIRVPDETNFGLQFLTQLPVDAMSGGFHRWFFGDWDATSAPIFNPRGIVLPSPTTANTFIGVVPAADGNGKLPNTPLWIGRGFGEYIANPIDSTGQHARQRPARATGNGGTGSSGLDALRSSTTSNDDFHAGFGFAGLGLGAGYNTGESDSEQDFMDMNGDRLPDAVYLDGSRLNNGTVIAGNKDGHLFGKFGGSSREMRIVVNQTLRFGLELSDDNQLVNQSDSDGKSSKFIMTGFNAGVDYGFSATHVEVVDINGDGLPDHIKRDSSSSGDQGAIHVELNLGHAFSKEIIWPTAAWTDQVGSQFAQDANAAIASAAFFLNRPVSIQGLRFQDTTGANLGFGVDTGIFGGGGGETITQSRTFVDLIDLNGDGLPDQVLKDAGASNELKVKLNLGDSFADEQPWHIPSGWAGATLSDPRFINGVADVFGVSSPDPDALAFTRGNSGTGSVSVDVCFVLCVGGSAFHEEGSNAAEMQFEDIDGDGKLDHVLKLDGGNQVIVKRNHTGTSNLLTRVDRPLGGQIALGYQRDGNRVSIGSFDMPNNQYVLSDVKVLDGRSNSYESTIAYGSSVYNRAEREKPGLRRRHDHPPRWFDDRGAVRQRQSGARAQWDPEGRLVRQAEQRILLCARASVRAYRTRRSASFSERAVRVEPERACSTGCWQDLRAHEHDMAARSGRPRLPVPPGRDGHRLLLRRHYDRFERIWQIDTPDACLRRVRQRHDVQGLRRGRHGAGRHHLLCYLQ